MLKQATLVSILALSFILGLTSQSKAEEFKIPELTSPVMDEAGVIGGNRASVLSQLLREANARNKVQLTVLTLPTLGNMPIEQASIEIVDKWKLGKKGTDNGVLFLVVPSERKARIEVGKGLEGDIPDVIAKRILADVSRSYFKRGMYGDGILAGAVEIIKRVDPDFTLEGYAQQVPPPMQHVSTEKLSGNLIIFILFLIFIILRILAGGFWGGGFGGGGGWSSSGGNWGGGSSGGGWSGGGGGFSGGGSSDSW